MTQCQLGDRAEILRGRNAAGGITRQVYHQRAGARADQRGKPLRIHCARCIQRIGDGNCPGESHDRRIDRETWVRHEYFVARLEHGEKGIEQHRLGTGHDHDVLRRGPHAAPGQ